MTPVKSSPVQYKVGGVDQVGSAEYQYQQSKDQIARSINQNQANRQDNVGRINEQI